MNDTLQAIYNHIIADLLPAYNEKTGYPDRTREWERRYNLLRDQLASPQQVLLEELDEASNWRQAAELEAMFLAALDQWRALFRS